MFLNKKVALAAGVGILTAVLLGGAALAAFAPVTENVPSALEGEMGTATPANSGTDKLKSILDGLVAKGLITIGQADAILAAVKAAEPVRDNGVKRIFASLLDPGSLSVFFSAMCPSGLCSGQATPLSNLARTPQTTKP